MRFDPFKKTKYREIIAAPELLRIAALSWKMPVIVTFLLYGVVTTLFVFSIAGSATRSTTGVSVTIITSVFLSALYACAVVGIRLISKEKGPLIFTERGIVSLGFIAFRWTDIDGYSWQTYPRKVVAPSPKGGGTSLLIKGKNSFMPYYRNRLGISLVACFGYFFDESQIQKADAIMQRFAVKKMKNNELF